MESAISVKNNKFICSVLSYNVAGLKNKIEKVNFFSFVKEFDIFCLYETFLEEADQSHFESFFANYKLCWIGAEREVKFGRAKKGYLYGIKLNLISEGFSFQVIERQNLIMYQKDNVSFYVLPVYISIDKWKEDFEQIRSVFSACCNSNLILIGDCNVRIGEDQTIPSELIVEGLEPNRKSRDRTTNKKGEELLGF